MKPLHETRAELKVLVIEDDPATADHTDALVREWGYQARTASSGRAAMATSKAWNPHVALVDLGLPDVSGIDLLREFRVSTPQMDTVVISGDRSLQAAVETASCGALCFLEKPVSPITLRSILAQAEYRHVHVPSADAATGGGPVRLGDLISQSAGMREAIDLSRLVAPPDANVLIVGENGTGKELVADAIHALSPRRDRPFVKVNCAAIPEELMEAELFGHKRGAFTDAIADRVGIFESVSGGTLLLDEVGEMPPYLQTKLLRVLQERQARPLGGARVVDLDFRLISATNCDLKAATDEGRFRPDLYFRINTITIALPALRDRPEDIPLLADHFLARYSARYGRPGLVMDDAVMERLRAHQWRGNVRELEHAIERAVIICRNGHLGIDDLPESLRGTEDAGSPPPKTIDGFPALAPLAELERLAIVRALEHTNGNKRAAAALLGIYRPTLYSKLRKYGLLEPETREEN